jgi:hypothetical protein
MSRSATWRSCIVILHDLLLGLIGAEWHLRTIGGLKQDGETADCGNDSEGTQTI